MKVWENSKSCGLIPSYDSCSYGISGSPKTATLFFDLRRRRQVRGFYRSDFPPHQLSPSVEWKSKPPKRTVELRSTYTRLIRTLVCNGQFPLSRRTALIFSLKKILIYRQPHLTNTGYLCNAYLMVTTVCAN